MKKITPLIFFLFLNIIDSIAQFGNINPVAPTFFKSNTAQFFDFDMDGDLDVLSAKYSQHGKIAWMENTDGLGNFAKPVIIYQHPTIQFSDIVPFDLDDDGDLDLLAVGNYENAVNTISRSFFLIENLGAINSYASPVEITTISNSQYFIRDINGDNYPDLIHKSTGDQIIWHLHLGGLSYGDAHIYQVNNIDLVYFDIADFNDDGRFDMVFTAHSPQVVYRYYGIPNSDDFVEASPLFSAGYFDRIKLAKMDADDDLDLLLWGHNGVGFSWHENEDGQGDFATNAIIIDTVAASNAVIEVADFDNDGVNDLVYGFDDLSNDVLDNHILKIGLNNNGNGIFDNFQPFYSDLDGTFGTDTGDVNGDGYLDLLMSSSGDQALRIFKNDGLGSFTPPDLLGNIGLDNCEDVVVADFDNDGIPDIAEIEENKISLLQRNSMTDDFLSETVIFDNLTEGFAMDGADLDGDGDIDLVASDEETFTTFLLENDGQGNFTESVLLTNNAMKEFNFSDINGDGLVDIVFIARENFSFDGINIGWLENLGNGFAAPIYLGQNIYESEIITVTDVDMDGDMDVMVPIRTFQINTRLAIYRQNSSGLFDNAVYVTPELAGYDRGSQFSDYDNDGDLDFLSLIYSVDTFGSGRILFFENPSNNTNSLWTENLIHEEEYTPSQDDYFAIHDLDNDGFKDALIVGGLGYIGWYKNVNGSLAFVDTLNFFSEEVLFENLDDDADLEIILRSRAHISWLENQINHGSASGTVFLDENENGIKEPDEIGLNNQTIQIDPQSAYAWTGNDGIYGFGLSPGNYDLSLIADDEWLPTSPSPQEVSIQSADDNQVFDFGLKPNGQIYQMETNFVTGFFRCNMNMPFWIMYYNSGNQTANGMITLELDPLATFISSVPSPVSINGNTIQWSISDVPPTQDGKILAHIDMPGVDEIGEVINFNTSITVVDDNNIPVFTDEYEVLDELICAYDPNDKLVSPAYPNFENYVLFGDTLEYTIRFQNTGNDTAFNVKIVDFLAENLDPTTFRAIGASHDFEVTMNEHQQVIFQFNNILLPDSTTNFVGSQGFVKYRIQPKVGLPNNSIINNEAHIFFDQNPAIITNVTESILVNKLPLETVWQNPICHDEENGFIQILPLLHAVDYQWNTGESGNEILELNAAEYTVVVTDFDGRWLFDTTIVLTNPPELILSSFSTPTSGTNADGTAGVTVTGGEPPYEYIWNTEPIQMTPSITNLPSGNYTVVVTDAGGCQRELAVEVEQTVSTSEIASTPKFSIEPNPNTGDFWINVATTGNSRWELALYDVYGKKLKKYTSKEYIPAQSIIKIKDLAIGVYFVSFFSENKVTTQRVIVQK